MSIKVKISALLIFIFIFYSLSFLTIQYKFLDNIMNSIEQNMAKKDISKLINILETEKSHLLTITSDYATGDDTYKYVGNKKYISRNANDSVLDNLNLSLFIIYDKNSDIVYSRIKDKTSKWVNLTKKEELKNFTPNKYFKNGVSGLVTISGKIYLFAASPILSSEKKEAGGVFVFGRVLSEVMNNKLKSLINVDFQTFEFRNKRTQKWEIDNIYKNIDNNTSFSSIDSEKIAIRKSSESLIKAYKPLKDIGGIEVGFIQVSTPRSVNLMLLKSRYILYSYLLSLGIFIISMINLLFSKIILNPLKILSDTIESFQLDNEIKTINVIGIINQKDEMGLLAKNFEKMKYNIIEKHKEIKELSDTLEKKVAERTKELNEANQSLVLSEKIFKETAEGICITNNENKILKVNKSFCILSGYDSEELIGKNINILKSKRHDAQFYKKMWTQINETGYWCGEIWDKKKTGEFYPKWMSINAIKYNSENVTHYVEISNDISKIKQDEENIKHMAYYDSLTGLPNRLLFNEILERSIARSVKYNRLTVLMFLDLDRFKNVNDTLGHSVGDQVLIEVGKRIKSAVKNSDTVSRLGGDEFTIILEEIERDQELVNIAERIIRDISKPIYISERNIEVGVSIGIAIAPTDDASTEGLIMKADSTMYCSKENGKGRYTFYSEEIQIKNLEFSKMEQKIKKAIELSQFKLYLQPQVSSVGENKVITGAEALIRIEEDDKEIIMPDKFILIAEELGLIIPIGRWIIEEACKQAAVLSKFDSDFHIAVNVSIKQLEDRELVNIIKNAIESNGISPNNIEIELTESVFYKDINQIIETLNEIKKIGIKIGIDDFGTGFSSLSALKKLPVDYLKIDKSFVDNIEINEDKELVSSIIVIAKNLNLNTVVEGVETKEQLDILAKYNPLLIQGYYFSKPLEFNSFLNFYEKFEKDNPRKIES